MFSVTVDDKLVNLDTKLSELMNQFSAFATIFLPLQFVAGLWGMNVIVPGQDDGEWVFYVIIAVSFGLFIAFALIFQLKKYWTGK